MIVIPQKRKKIIAVFQMTKSGLNQGLLVMCSIVVRKRPISLNLYALTKKTVAGITLFLNTYILSSCFDCQNPMTVGIFVPASCHQLHASTI